MRRVNVFKKNRVPAPQYFEMVQNGSAWFHEWGIVSEELDVGALVNTVAIIERDDGFVETVSPEMIRFVD